MELCVSLGCFACVETSSRSIITSTSSVAAFFLFDISFLELFAVH